MDNHYAQSKVQKFKVPLQDEVKIVDYLSECYEQGDPRTTENISHEIANFLHVYNYDNKFHT